MRCWSPAAAEVTGAYPEEPLSSDRYDRQPTETLSVVPNRLPGASIYDLQKWVYKKAVIGSYTSNRWTLKTLCHFKEIACSVCVGGGVI